jgi:hypothetical protein
MEEQIIVGQSQDPMIDNLTRDQIAKALGLQNFGEIKKNQDHIQRLIDWAQAKGAKDTTDIVWAVKQLANRVGSPKIGNNWAEHLGQYAYLELERIKIEDQLKEIENGEKASTA